MAAPDNVTLTPAANKAHTVGSAMIPVAPAKAGHLLQRLYSAVLYLLVPVFLLHLLVSVRRNRGYLRRVHERFGLVSTRLRGQGCLWIHAVSVGEVRAALPLVEELSSHYPDRPILLTTTTPAGSDAAARLFGERLIQAYLPWDLPGAVERFLARVEPSAVLILETELWPNLFSASCRRGIPLLVVSGRLSARSLWRYSLIKPLVRHTLLQCAAILARSEEDAQRFLALGAPRERVRVGGNIKFDFGVPEEQKAAALALRLRMGGRRVWTAASTHPGEESLVLAVHQRLRCQLPDLLLVLVPRHPERFNRVAALCANQRMPVIRRSACQPILPETSVLLGDTMGELPFFYALSDAAFVGGSLVPVGGHNPLEPAAQGLAAIVGPHTFKITDTLRLFLPCKAMVQVMNADGLYATLSHLLNHPEDARHQGGHAQRLLFDNRGVSKVIVQQLAEHMSRHLWDSACGAG